MKHDREIAPPEVLNGITGLLENMLLDVGDPLSKNYDPANEGVIGFMVDLFSRRNRHDSNYTVSGVPIESISARGKASLMEYQVLTSALIDKDTAQALTKLIEYYNALWSLQVMQLAPFGEDINDILNRVKGGRNNDEYFEESYNIVREMERQDGKILISLEDHSFDLEITTEGIEEDEEEAHRINTQLDDDMLHGHTPRTRGETGDSSLIKDTDFLKVLDKLTSTPTRINITVYPNDGGRSSNSRAIKITLSIKANQYSMQTVEVKDLLAFSQRQTSVGKRIRRIKASTGEIRTMKDLIMQQDIAKRNKRLLYSSRRIPYLKKLLKDKSKYDSIKGSDSLMGLLSNLISGIGERWKRSLRDRSILPTATLVCTRTEFEQAMGTDWKNVLNGRKTKVLDIICNSIFLLALVVVDATENEIYIRFSGVDSIIQISFDDTIEVLKASSSEDKQMQIIEMLARKIA